MGSRFGISTYTQVEVKVAQSCPTFCNPMDYTVHRLLQTRILERVTFPFSRGCSQPRDRTQVSRIAGRLFTSWATREAQEYWSGQPIPSPVDFPNPGIEPGSPALQADSLPTELSGKPHILILLQIIRASGSTVVLREHKHRLGCLLKMYIPGLKVYTLTSLSPL